MFFRKEKSEYLSKFLIFMIDKPPFLALTQAKMLCFS